LLIEQHWVEADSTVPNNAEFAREPLPVTFDWSLPEYPAYILGRGRPVGNGIHRQPTRGLHRR